MNNFITAEGARRNAETCRNVVAKNPLFNTSIRDVRILFAGYGDRVADDMILKNIYEEICERSCCGGHNAKIRIDLRSGIKVAFTEISSLLKNCGFDVIYGGDNREVEMLVEW